MPDPTASQQGLSLATWFQNLGLCAGPREPIQVVRGEMLLTGPGFRRDSGPLLAAPQAGPAQAERAGLWAGQAESGAAGQAEAGERPGGRGCGTASWMDSAPAAASRKSPVGLSSQTLALESNFSAASVTTRECCLWPGRHRLTPLAFTHRKHVPLGHRPEPVRLLNSS